MIKHLLFVLCVLLVPAAFPHAAGDSEEAAKAAELMRKVNEWQFMHPIMTSGCRNWIRGTWYTGVMAAYKATGDQRYLDQALAWGRQHQWQVGNEKQGANRLFCVETWAELYFIKKDRAMIAPAIHALDAPSTNSPSGAKIWYAENGLRYADSLYGAPALAMLAKATGERKYLDWMNAFFWDVHAELFDPATGLFFRDKRFIHKPNPNGKKTLWSRGNGWVAGGIVRILEYLPSGDPMRARYEELLTTMAASLAKRQGADGLWRMNLDDPAEFPMPETSGTGFFVYAIAWGVNNGVLDRAKYEPIARNGWTGLSSCIASDGQVLWGQKVGANPYAIEKSDTHEYVTGTFLLAGAEMFNLLGGKPARPLAQSTKEASK